MNNSYHKKISSNKLDSHLPSVQNHLDSQVRKILNQLSNKKDNQTKNQFNTLTNTIFSLKLSKYDIQGMQRKKFQLINQLSPPKWKVSTNVNSEFSHNQRVKGVTLTGWDIQRANLSKRSYQQPKQYNGIKFDLFSRQFPDDFSKTYSKGFNKKLRQIETQYEKKVHEGNIKTIQQKGRKSIDAIRSRGTRFQLSKDKLFGFNNSVKNSPRKQNQLRNTISSFYSSTGSKKLK